MNPMRIAIDTGGTFTDCVHLRGGEVEVLKVASTPDDPGRALLEAVTAIAPVGGAEIAHGTTVGTNALLQRKGARVAFVTTRGFEDTIAIGRQARPRLYDLLWKQEPPLVPAELRFGIAERVACDGTLLEAVTSDSLERLKCELAAAQPESIALSLLFGFANPENEARVAAALRELEVPVSVGHEILPEFREYERASTLVINAYLAPLMERYLRGIRNALEKRPGTRFQVMQSSGGIISPVIAAREPVRTILSGPAGGLIGAAAVARAAGYGRILTFDMGGTSTDVAFVVGGGAPVTTRESSVLGMPVAVPMLDIHTVGAGGGSLARFDAGGVLQVGPESAGALPGPICYGRGELPTVTDANLLLGRFGGNERLAGGVSLLRQRTREAFLQAKGPLATIEEFAEGIVRVVDARMAKALRRVSVERGQDPRECVLVSFGGAGPLHAVAVARALEIPQVLVSNLPGALSAYGILVSDFVRDYSRTVMLPAGDRSLHPHFLQLEEQALREMRADGLSGATSRSLDMRYAGQGFELQVAYSQEAVASFHRLHEQQYGYSDLTRPVEIVTARVRAIAPTEPVDLRPKHQTAANGEIQTGNVYYEGRWVRARYFDRQRLASGAQLEGPAVVMEYSATTFLPPGSAAKIDERGNLLIQVNACR